ncbi:trace amine-associated receptor 1 [Oryzias melastigma]|uniref:Trace amine-associated receptor 1-like n=1 Tax=Oryzias melastigma TaxID=30732 RepID=A0A3B3DI34_ORYME|nr:trace amine-associated receptor 1 [Oryzias melastigma]
MEQENKTQTFPLNTCYKLASFVLTETTTTACTLLNLFLSSMSAVTVCGNLLVITSVVYFRQLHTPTNALVLSLAVTDLLVGAVVLPLTMKFSVSTCLYNRSVFCLIRRSLDMIIGSCSILNLCCISVDRYYAVCQPLTYRLKISNPVIGVMILTSWLLPALFAVGFQLGFNRANCVQRCLSFALLTQFISFVFLFYLPLILMLCLYFKIFLVAQKQASSLQKHTKCRENPNRTEKKATKTLAIVMGVFLLCWLPSFFCITVVSFSKSTDTGPLIEILNWLALSNSLLNPFIYAFFYSWFRSAFRLIISGKIFFTDLTNMTLQ